jgi:hypothetical protein
MRRFVPGAVLAALALVFVPAAAAWTWPAAGDVVQQYSFDPAHPYAAGQHRGIDVAGDRGSTVAAPAAGSVTFAGSVPSSGLSVTITTADGYAVTLTHLGTLLVARGAAVDEGDAVGTIGPSGDAEVAVPYVHLGIRIAADEQGYVDPLGLLPPRGAPAPAPTSVPAPPASPAASAPAPQPTPESVTPAAPDPTPDAGLPADPPAPAAATAEPVTAQTGAAPSPVAAARRSHADRHQPAVSSKPSASPAPAATRRPVRASIAPAVHPARVVHRVATPARPAIVHPAAARHPAAHLAAPPARRSHLRVRRPEPTRAAHHVLLRVADRTPAAADARRPSEAPVGAVRRPPSVAPPQRTAPFAPMFVALAAAALALVLAGAAAVLRSRGGRKPVRIIAANVDTAEEGLGCTGVAVRLGSPPPWPRGGLRGSVGRLRALPPAEGRRRAHGQRYGRARYAGDGRRGSRGEVLR